MEIFNISKMNKIRETYDSMLHTEDPAHGYCAFWVMKTSDWIKSLDLDSREYVFMYIQYILARSGDIPEKTMTIMMMYELSYLESITLLEQLIAEGEPKHTKMDLDYAISAINKIRQS